LNIEGARDHSFKKIRRLVFIFHDPSLRRVTSTAAAITAVAAIVTAMVEEE